MPGVNNGFVGQNEQSATDVFTQIIEIPACEVGPAYAALKQNISGKHTVISLAVEYQTAR
jgi:hypothetical protein